jgi:hypothetical protein
MTASQYGKALGRGGFRLREDLLSPSYRIPTFRLAML